MNTVMLQFTANGILPSRNEVYAQACRLGHLSKDDVRTAGQQKKIAVCYSTVEDAIKVPHDQFVLFIVNKLPRVAVSPITLRLICFLRATL